MCEVPGIGVKEERAVIELVTLALSKVHGVSRKIVAFSSLRAKNSIAKVCKRGKSNGAYIVSTVSVLEDLVTKHELFRSDKSTVGTSARATAVATLCHISRSRAATSCIRCTIALRNKRRSEVTHIVNRRLQVKGSPGHVKQPILDHHHMTKEVRELPTCI